MLLIIGPYRVQSVPGLSVDVIKHPARQLWHHLQTIKQTAVCLLR